MVVKIGNSEYLTRVNNMTAVEKEEYLSRVEEWLKVQAPLLVPKMEEETARFQNVIQCSVGWNDAECKAWTDGVKLLTAYAATGETWLPEMLYVKAARRSIKRMAEVLGQNQNENQNENENRGGEAEGTGDIAQDVASFRSDASNGDIAGGDKDGEGNDNENDNENKSAGTAALVPVRPKHIDQYVHLLPKKTQERAAGVQDLLRELDVARENARKLMDNNAHPDTIAQWAKMATNLDNKLKSIYQELDDEWARLVKSGRVTVDDLGNAHVVPGGNDNENDNENEKVELTPEQRERRRNLRKWLTDTRRGNGAAREERVKKWHENFAEYLTLEGDAAFKDEKIIEAARHYGIDISELKIKK